MPFFARIFKKQSQSIDTAPPTEYVQETEAQRWRRVRGYPFINLLEPIPYSRCFIVCSTTTTGKYYELLWTADSSMLKSKPKNKCSSAVKEDCSEKLNVWSDKGFEN